MRSGQCGRRSNEGTAPLEGRRYLTGRHFLAAVLIVLLSSIRPAIADGESFQSGSQPAPTRRADPYKKLFQPPPLEQMARAQRPTSSAPRIVCGMIVIPTDPNIDPKIFIERKPDDTRYTIRSIEPPVCK